jgi:hypothetical protein
MFTEPPLSFTIAGPPEPFQPAAHLPPTTSSSITTKWTPRVSHNPPLLFFFTVTRAVGAGRAPMPAMAPPSSALAHSDARHAARKRRPPSIHLPETLAAPPYKSPPAGLSLFRRHHWGSFPLSTAREEERGIRRRRRRSCRRGAPEAARGGARSHPRCWSTMPSRSPQGEAVRGSARTWTLPTTCEAANRAVQEPELFKPTTTPWFGYLGSALHPLRCRTSPPPPREHHDPHHCAVDPAIELWLNRAS